MPQAESHLMKDRTLKLILGPTAVGKTDYCLSLARSIGSPVVSCDSRQIFREMKIGTAAPADVQIAMVPHYFIGNHSVSEYYTAGKYELEALDLLERLFLEHDTIVMTGGSGLYADALCFGLDDFPETDWDLRTSLMERLEREGVESLRMELRRLDPQAYASMDIANTQRVVRALEVCLMTGRSYSSFKTAPHKKRFFRIERYCLTRPRDVLYDRINKRVDDMLDAGLVEEVRSLTPYRHMPALRTVGYKEVFDYLDGKTSLDRARELICRNTRHYAKRQLSYWNRAVEKERKECPIRWIEL